MSTASEFKRATEGDPERLKQTVRGFYERIGWTQDAGGVFEDANRYEDLRPVTAEYRRRCHHRVKLALPPRGRYLLDVASGPVQQDDFFEYSADHTYRVCVDLTMSALSGARRRVGDRGLYVLGDITRLPFRDDTFDGVCSLHTIYHVPARQQASAFLELYRVLGRGMTAAVVYSWGKHGALMFLFDAVPNKLAAMWRVLRARLARKSPTQDQLYFEPQSPAWFRREVAAKIPVEVRVWRSLSPTFSRHLVPGGTLGAAFLRRVFALEERFPRAIGWIGAYPMMVLRKPAGR